MLKANTMGSFGSTARDQRSEGLQRRGGGESRLCSSATDLGANKPRPDVEQPLVSFVAVDPLELERRFARQPPSLRNGRQRVHFPIAQEPNLLFPGRSD